VVFKDLFSCKDTVIVEVLNISPPLLRRKIPNYYLAKGLLNYVFSFIFAFIFDFSGTVTTTREATNITLRLPLRLNDIMRSK